ncbi:MAG: methylmalonyl Co-A mutase-associated GTPase MeaB, partial [Candidatus Helarchaeota archaeon]|nr:methylmalonyl Co-A mutase-associated GTPase MeaB [Candidatus Helarchaeota archaeon]
PGAGKSSLINSLTTYMTSQGHSIGIISVDPSSPYTGGAFLGDRVRMRENILNPKVYIRSVASRGSTGGLAIAIYDIASVFDAFGFDFIIIETVGAGQSVVDIFPLAYTIILVMEPGMGDSVQVQKAGILEIADILVINKSDLGGDFLKVNLNMMLESYKPKAGWNTPIVRTIATEGVGAAELFQTILAHKNHLEAAGLLEEKRRHAIRIHVQNLIESLLIKTLAQKFALPKKMDEIMEAVSSSSKDIYTAIFEFLQPIFERLDHL